MNLLNLSVAILEAILFLPRTIHGKDAITEKHLRPIAAIVDWEEQREAWEKVVGKTG